METNTNSMSYKEKDDTYNHGKLGRWKEALSTSRMREHKHHIHTSHYSHRRQMKQHHYEYNQFVSIDETEKINTGNSRVSDGFNEVFDVIGLEDR